MIGLVPGHSGHARLMEAGRRAVALVLAGEPNGPFVSARFQRANQRLSSS